MTDPWGRDAASRYPASEPPGVAHGRRSVMDGAGSLLGMAAGDALGAGYEFASSPQGEIAMIGGGLGDFAPGEWTDDTSMAVCIVEVTARGRVDLEAIGDRFLDWYRAGPADIGISTAAVLGQAASGADLPRVAASVRRRPSAGGGRQRGADAHRSGRVGPPR
jgi:ADP-ribosyl-[dinitrogen reductase] hydrolase